MATVTGKTSSKIDELLGPTIVGAELDSQGALSFTRKNGGKINAGSLGASIVSATINSAKRLILTTMGGQEVDAGSIVPNLLGAWPIGSIFFTFSDQNPNTLLGGGTWARVAKGKMIVGVDEADTSFDAVRETGGSKTKTLLEANLPAHAHSINHDHPNTTISMRFSENTAWGGSNTGMRVTDVQGLTGGGGSGASITVNVPPYTGNSGPGPGTSTSFDVMNPYITAFIWERTA
jgi:hypothetical protein